MESIELYLQYNYHRKVYLPGVEFVANFCLKYGDIIDHSNEGDQSCNQISSR